MQVKIDEVKISAKTLAETISLIADGTISSKIAKELAPELLEGVAEDGGVRALVEERGMGQISDEQEIRAIIQKVIEANPKQAEQYRCEASTAKCNALPAVKEWESNGNL
jgi:aspartyl-tRNA(Asn)/glutamyl-tRNA(Gln) amidotransferase subunit B